MTDTPFVSVVVPAYNAQPTIRHTIQSLVSQTYPGEYEIIVVDDGSTDRTSEIVRSFSEVKYIRQPNAGPAAARNRGAADSKGEVILFTDSDCAAHKDWIERIVGGFSSDEIAAVCGSYGIANPENILAGCIHDEIIFRHRRIMSCYPQAFGSYNVGIRRSVFWRVGGFDESYRRASGEDNDLSYKILKTGGRIFFAKNALVDHYHTTQLEKYLREQFSHGFWRVRIYWRHPDMVKGDGYTFWKDMVEVPLVGLTCLAVLFSMTGFLRPYYSILFIVLPFWFLEIYFATVICRNIYAKFYFSFVMLLRAFVRSFGLSTGILDHLIKIFKKLSEKKPIKP